MKLHALLFLTLIGSAFAEEAVATTTTQPETIAIQGSKLSFGVPYSKGYKMVKRALELSEGLVTYRAKITLQSQPDSIQDVRLILMSENELQTISLDKNLSFDVPLYEKIAQEEGEFRINRAQKDIGVQVNLRLTAKIDHLTVDTAYKSLSAAKKVMSDAIPWYGRVAMFVTGKGIKGVSICHPEQDQTISIGDPMQAIATLKTEHKVKKYGQLRYCAALDESANYPRDARIHAPEGAELVLTYKA